jgi:predicted transcriptional regulator
MSKNNNHLGMIARSTPSQRSKEGCIAEDHPSRESGYQIPILSAKESCNVHSAAKRYQKLKLIGRCKFNHFINILTLSLTYRLKLPFNK